MTQTFHPRNAKASEAAWKNISQIGSFSQLGVKIKTYIWKHHPDKLFQLPVTFFHPSLSRIFGRVSKAHAAPSQLCAVLWPLNVAGFAVQQQHPYAAAARGGHARIASNGIAKHERHAANWGKDWW